MGGLGAPFILCPLSDRKELIGMSTDDGKVILTTGKNMAIRYHMLEQKQETSWTSSRHWFTSRVVKIPEIEKYGSVLDNNTVALWDEDDTALNSVTKLKFSDPIYELHPFPRENDNDGIMVIFENGFMTHLTNLLAPDQHKKAVKGVASGKGFIEPRNHCIIACSICDDDDREVVIISTPKIKNAGRSIVKRKQITATFIRDNVVISSVIVDKEIVGHCILPSGHDPAILYLDDDGRLYYQSLLASTTTAVQTKPTTNTNSLPLPPPMLIGSLGKLVSVKTPVVIRPTPRSSSNGDYSKIVVYGSDPSEEGALVFLYDLKYDIVVVKQALKLYGTPPIMDTVGNNIIIPVGLHVLVIALYSSKSILSGIIGKHGMRRGEEVFEQRAPFSEVDSSSWDVDTVTIGKPRHQKTLPVTTTQKKKKSLAAAEVKELKAIKHNFPTFWEIVRQYKILEREGQPQSLICSQILVLALEKGQDALEWMLQTFVDIPESHLVAILINSLQNVDENNCGVAQPLIDRVLGQAIDTKELGVSLCSLEFSSVRILSLYLKCRMEAVLGDEEENAEVDNGDILRRCVTWLTCLLDAHYTNFVLGNESDLVDKLLGVVERGTAWMEEIAELEPYLILTRGKIDFHPKPNPHSKWRTEVITFV